MKKIALTVFFVSMLFNSAFAEVTGTATLTTKGYVDDGLRYLYGIKANKNDVYTKEESDAKYLTSVDIAEMDGTAYTGDNGVTINNHQVELSVDAHEGSMYVYTSDGWSELPVEDEWNADIFTPTSGD